MVLSKSDTVLIGSYAMPLTQMQTAYDHLNEHRNILRMTTGSANLDSLIDSIQEGQFYLFYGSNKTFLDGLLVNCILPVREKHGFESMTMYINIEMVLRLQQPYLVISDSTGRYLEILVSAKTDSGGISLGSSVKRI